MKRDLNLIRELLLYIESSDHLYLQEETFYDICQDASKLRYNIYLMVDSGLIDAIDITGHRLYKTLPIYNILYLTSAGCDYLDSVRDQSVWNQVCEILTNVGGSASLEIVKSIATKLVTHVLDN